MDELHNRDWGKLWLRLFVRCAWLLRKRYQVKWDNEKLKKFSNRIISEVNDKIFLEKVRNWNLDEYDNFEDFIISVIDSHVNNTLNKKNKEIATSNVVDLYNKSGVKDVDSSERISTAELRKQIFDELQNAGADDEELLIFECMADGIIKPENIKKELGLDDKQFHNIWRRFKRKRDLIKSKLAADGY